MLKNTTSIGIFDSGYGGLTIMKEIRKVLPNYNFIYLGDNARSPYGGRSFEVVYKFTLQAVEKLFSLGCSLVILACNTASAKALRNIQQNYLPNSKYANRRVLGIIRPTVECLASVSKTQHIGVLGTEGTILSHSYQIEIAKLFPTIVVNEEPCPIWVPLVETGESDSEGADFFIKKHLDQILQKDPRIDTLLLACTHYPLLLEKIRKYLSEDINVISQGEYVAVSLQDYLQRHPEIDELLAKKSIVRYLTTEQADNFKQKASKFLEELIEAEKISID